MTGRLEGAPETIWACYPLSGKREQGTIYGYDIEYFDPTIDVDDDFDDPCGVASYTLKATSDARIHRLEAALTELSCLPHTTDLLWWQKIARDALKIETKT